jgi:hypothetical protein
MNLLTEELIKKATSNSKVNPEKLVELVVQHCVQIVLSYDDIFIAEDLSNTFQIKD